MTIWLCKATIAPIKNIKGKKKDSLHKTQFGLFPIYPLLVSNEKIISTQVSNYVKANVLSDSNQSACRQVCSTETSLVPVGSQ